MTLINKAAPSLAALLLTGSPLVMAEDEQRTEASASLGAAVNSGNSESERYNANIDYLKRSSDHRFVFNAEANRGESEGIEDANNTRAATTYDWFFHGPWYANSNLSWHQDRLSDLYSRYALGAGAGYQFFDDERIRLSVEFGPNYIYEETLETGETSDEAAGRWALDYRHNLNEGAVSIFHRHEIVMIAEDTDNWYATTRTGLRIPVREHLSASLQLNYDYENQRRATAEENYDASTIINLTYNWN